jgi:hypothetical protein
MRFYWEFLRYLFWMHDGVLDHQVIRLWSAEITGVLLNQHRQIPNFHEAEPFLRSRKTTKQRYLRLKLHDTTHKTTKRWYLPIKLHGITHNTTKQWYLGMKLYEITHKTRKQRYLCMKLRDISTHKTMIIFFTSAKTSYFITCFLDLISYLDV